MGVPLSISIGRDHEFRHILWAMHGSDHVLFCTVCDATIDVRDNWQAFNQTHRKCVRVEPEAVVSMSPDASPETVKAIGEMIHRAHEQFKKKYHSGGCPA